MSEHREPFSSIIKCSAMKRCIPLVLIFLCIFGVVSSADTTPPAKVTDLKVLSITGSSVTITWTAPGDDENIGTAASYDIRYSRSFITEANWDDSTKVWKAEGEPKPQAAGSTETFEVTGLRTYTLYYVVLKTSDEAGNVSELSNMIMSTTMEVELSEGVPVKGELYNVDDVAYYKVKASSGQHLSIILDKEPGWYSYLYIRYGQFPTTSEYDVKADRDKWDQAVDITTPSAGYYYIMVKGYDSSSGYGSYAICAYTPASLPTLNIGTAVVDSLLDRYDVDYYQVYVDDWQHLSVILDKEPGWYSYLYIRYGELPTTSEYDAMFDRDKSDQAVDIPVTSAGYYYIMITGYYYSSSSPGYGSYDICAYTTASFPTLNIGTAVVDSLLDSYDAKYYQVHVDDWQHLSVILDKEPGWYSYLYIRYGELPTTSEYDAMFDRDKSDQAVDIPVTSAGYYYIMITGYYYSSSSPGYGSYAIGAFTSESSSVIHPKKGWPQSTGGDVWSSPVLGDIDNDGWLDVVVGSHDNKVHAWNGNGSLISGWPKNAGGDVYSSPSLGDIDGDGRLEVVVGSYDNKVYVWKGSGAIVSGWPQVTGDDIWKSSAALGDLDGDGILEIIVGSHDKKVYAWNEDGSAVSGWPKSTRGEIWSSPALGDIDGDGVLEVVVGSRDSTVYAWNGDGTEVAGWPKSMLDGTDSSPALGDIDNDGLLEIVIGSNDHNVYAWNGDGTAVEGWPRGTDEKVRSSPAFGDIDGDGAFEIVVGSDDNKVYAWNSDGSAVPGWPQTTGGDVATSPALGDIDGDNQLEIIMGSDDNKVYAWNGDGTAVPGFPVNTGDDVISSPALGDLDGDGAIEIVVGSDDNKVYCWEGRPGSYNPDLLPWPMFRHDARRTGNFGVLVEPSAGILGDVNNSRTVNITDALIVASYDLDPAITIPNNGNIQLGDVNGDNVIKITDALIIATYDIDPTNVNLPSGIGKPVGADKIMVASLDREEMYPESSIAVRLDLPETEQKPGKKIDVAVNIDMTEVKEKLGAYSATLSWNPEVLSYTGYTGGNTEEYNHPLVLYEEGKLMFNQFDTEGAGGNVNIINVNFLVNREISGDPLSIEFSALTTAYTFHDLLPYLQVPDTQGMTSISSTLLPEIFSLSQNYPNPFNAETTIAYGIPARNNANLSIYSISGQKVRTLFDIEKEAGSYTVIWDGKNDVGQDVSSGLYLYQLKTERFVRIRRMVLVR